MTAVAPVANVKTRAGMLLAVVSIAAMGTSGVTRQRATPAPGTTRSVAAATAFLATLDEAKRAKAQGPLNNDTRIRWSNLPTGTTLQYGGTDRNGVRLGDLTPAQEKAALALLTSAFSREGYEKVMAIVDADQVLEDGAAPKRPATSRIRFGRAEYYLAILGTPSPADLWMLQFGGHHLAINVTFAGSSNVLTPSHTGTQPATYTLEGRTVRPLGDENDKAFALMNSLDPAVQKEATLGYQVKDTVLGPGHDGRVIQPEGVKAARFSAAQREALLELIREWVGIINDEAATARLAEVKASLADTWFAWSGPTTNGSPAYFRIQGPTVLIEYAPQGQGSPPDHIHAFYRDPTNDYGAKAAAR